MRANTLLILDDDSDDAHLIANEAKHLGFEVRIFDDVKLFTETFLAEKPSHLAIDILMPGVHGVDLVQILARHACQSSIILTSGLGTAILPAVQLAAIQYQLNIRGVMQRPFHQHILRNMLSDQVSVDLHAHTGNNISTQSFIVDAKTIDQALRNHEFTVFYQPQIDLVNGKVMGFEGLLRWKHPVFGIKLPELFIPVAEKTGQIEQLTQIVVETGFHFIRSLGHDLSFSFNISANSILNQSLTNTLLNVCKASDLKPERVVLELTDTATIDISEKAQHILARLREEGFKLSLDDFGNNNTSMTQLANLPFTELKIDKSLVTTMETSAKSRKLVSSTLKLAENLNIETIAEGIENTLAAIGLRELGCRYGQGYYFARPMDQEAALHWLQSWNRQF